MAADIAIIGGSGLYQFPGINIVRHETVTTPFGDTSAPIVIGEYRGYEVAFLARHGEQHHLLPHQVNYRANIWALHQLGVRNIVAVNAVGGIHAKMGPGEIVVVDQIIDYSWGREHTFAGAMPIAETHVDFSWPYDGVLRARLLAAATQLGLSHSSTGTYACTQGPRLESAAEIKRIQQDGGDVVGMTGMPEAGLARELGMPYACVCLVANWGAGLTDEVISIDEIHRVLGDGMAQIQQLLLTVLEAK